MANSTAQQISLLGIVGWCRAEWLGGYFPDDLPPDWRLAYLANHMNCVFLPAREWLEAQPEGLIAAVEEAPDELTFLLERSPIDALEIERGLMPFRQRRHILLTDLKDSGAEACEQRISDTTNCWVDPGSNRMLVRWFLERFELRELRGLVEELPSNVDALVIDGPGASPQRIEELRILLQLLGRA